MRSCPTTLNRILEENLGRRGTGVFLVNVGLRNENRLILLYETAVVFG
jgi:hypothetical protein